MSGTILLVDDVATNRVILRVKLTAARYGVIEAADGHEALTRAREARPDLILMDVSMPDMSGIDACRRLKADPATADIPVVIFSACPGETTKVEALVAGAEEFMAKPLDEMALMARIRSLLRARHTAQELALRDDTLRTLGLSEAPAPALMPPGRIALLAGSPQEAETWRTALGARMRHRLVILDHASVGEAAHNADLFVIAGDLGRPGSGDGLQMISELRARSDTRHAAIVVVLQDAARAHSAMALDLGATDIIVGGFEAEEMALRLSTHLRRKRQADQLRQRLTKGLELAVTDPLTGLYNRRYALSHLGRVRAHAMATGRAFTVMMLDLDRFKQVNDTYGHAAGDAVLRTVAQRLQSNLRAVDMLARIGGEEFLAILPECASGAATRAAERLRAVVEATPILLPGDGGPSLHQTVSIGVVAVAQQGTRRDDGAVCLCEDDLLHHADLALYEAKSAGRNSVTVDEMAA